MRDSPRPIAETHPVRARLATLVHLGLRPIRRHYGRTLLTLLGVAAGVGVTIGIDLAVRSSIGSFSRTARAVAGPAQLRVHRRPLALPESILAALRRYDARATLHPALEAPARARRADGYPFTILGLDLIGDPRFTESEPPVRQGDRTGDDGGRRLGSGSRAAPPRDPLSTVRELFDPDILYVPSPLARAMGLGDPSRSGQSLDSLTAIVGTRAYRFRVREIVTHGSIGAASVTVAFMDLAPFQERFGRIDQLDWVDVEPVAEVGAESARERHVERLRKDLAAMLAARRGGPTGPQGPWSDVRVEAPDERALQMERMLGAYRRNLRALSLISLVVGMLLAYNALLSSVLQRRSEIALLRALGASRGAVGLILGAEALLLGLLGGAMGVLLGRGLSEGALRLVSRTVGDLYARAAPVPVELTPEHWLIGIALGLASAAAASLGPLREGLRVRPLEFLREEHPGKPEPTFPWRRVVMAAGSAAVALWLVGHPEGIGRGARGYVGAAAALLAGALLALPAFVGAVRLLRAPLARLWAPAGRLAYATALAAHRRLSVSVAALLLAFSIVWGMASLVASFRVTVDSWAGATLRADLWVTPQSRAGSPAEGTMPASWRARFLALPEVADVDAVRVREISLGRELLWLGAGETAVLARRGFLPMVGGIDPRPLLARAAVERVVLVSEPLARRQRLGAGSKLLIPSPTGSHEYEVAGVYRDYSSDRGYLVMDRAHYVRDFGDSAVSTYALYLKPGVSREAGALAAERALDPEELIRVTDTRAIREEVRRVMRNTFAVTDALELVAVIVALLSVLGTLAALVLERRQEIGVLRAIGASRGQVVRALVVESSLLAIVGLLLGALTGVLLSAVLVHVLNRESFGWTLELSTPWRQMLAVAAILFLAALIAAIPPARRAAAVPPREAMSRA